MSGTVSMEYKVAFHPQLHYLWWFTSSLRGKTIKRSESDNKSILNILCSGEYFDEDIWSSGVSREIICPSIGCQSGPDKLIVETRIISGERG